MFFNLSNHTISYVVKCFCILWRTLSSTDQPTLSTRMSWLGVDFKVCGMSRLYRSTNRQFIARAGMRGFERPTVDRHPIAPCGTEWQLGRSRSRASLRAGPNDEPSRSFRRKSSPFTFPSLHDEKESLQPEGEGQVWSQFPSSGVILASFSTPEQCRLCLTSLSLLLGTRSHLTGVALSESEFGTDSGLPT